MSLEIVNSAARRDVKKTSRFTSLMKAGNCTAVKRTSGDTKHSVDAIKEIAYKYAYQTKDVAKALLEKSIADTITNNYNFLYNHFQYSADPELQQMRSPSCSWAERFTGIDCKSYSILASTLLINQGLVHYIRRIKQPGYQSNHWTHVYVVIPKNQTNYSLNEGYYIIDATLHNNLESNFLKKHDTLMSKLPHVWLNGPSASLQAQSELTEAANSFSDFLQVLVNNGVSGLTVMQLHNIFSAYIQNGQIPYVEISNGSVFVEGKPYNIGLITKGLSLSLEDFSGIFGSGWSPSCIGGTYDKRDLEYSSPIIIDGFQSLYDDFNSALSTQNLSLIQTRVNAILSSSGALKDHTSYTASYNWSSRCSRDVTRAFRKLANYYNDIATKAFFGYLNNFFNIFTGFITVSNISYPFETRGSDGLKKNEFRRNVQVIQVLSLEFKGIDVPMFEMTPYAVDNIQSEGFNLENFINTLSNIAIEFQGNSNGSSNGNTNGGTNTNVPENPSTSKAGIGLVPSILIGGATVLGLSKLYQSATNKSKTSKSKQNA